MKFCPDCGTALQNPNPKFCPECGTSLQAVGGATPSKSPPFQAQSVTQTSSSASQQSEEEELEPVKLNTYDLGIQLENTTASVFEKMGYTVERRKRVPTKSGAAAEIDLLLIRGNRRKAVECKNYDPSRSVGVSDLRVFKDKLTDTGIMSGIFVTNTFFSEDSQKLAESTGIELWDGDKHREKVYAYMIGRIRNPSLVQDPILPLAMDFSSASALSLRNNPSVRLFSSVLLYHPYILVKYRLQAIRNDPTGRSHTVTDSGEYVVDALDGDIVNRERGAVESIAGLFKKKEQRLESKEDKMVSEDLETIVPISKPVLSTPEYQVSVAEPAVTEEDATKVVKSHVIDKNKGEIDYRIKVRGEVETRSFNVVPRLKEVSIKRDEARVRPEVEPGVRGRSDQLLEAIPCILGADT